MEVTLPARGKHVAVLLGVTAGAAVLLLFPPERYGFYPRCAFRDLTGLLCPGCGGTRALAALLHGHFREAMRWNALVASAAPLSLAGWVVYVMVARFRPEWGARARLARWGEPVALGVLVVAMGFMVWRNFG